MGNLTIRPWQTHLLPSKACLTLLLQAGFFLNYCCTFQVAEVTWPPASTNLKIDCNNPKKSVLSVLLQPWALPQEPPQAQFSLCILLFTLCSISGSESHPMWKSQVFLPQPETHSWLKASQGSLDCLRQISSSLKRISSSTVAECSEGQLTTPKSRVSMGQEHRAGAASQPITDVTNRPPFAGQLFTLNQAASNPCSSPEHPTQQYSHCVQPVDSRILWTHSEAPF